MEKAFGPEHPQVARTLGNLSNVQRERGDLAAAEQSLTRALAIKKKGFGPEHPEAARGGAGKAEQGRRDEDHGELDEADLRIFRQQHVHRGGAAGEIDDADPDLQQRQRAARQRDNPVGPADHARLHPHPGDVAD